MRSMYCTLEKKEKGGERARKKTCNGLPSKALPPDLLHLLRWTFENIDVYFKGISRTRWIPRPDALQVVQACHNFTDSRQRVFC